MPGAPIKSEHRILTRSVEENACEEESTSLSKGVTSIAEILGTILKTCIDKIKVLGMTCEIRLEPEGNEKFKAGTAKNEGTNIRLTSESTFLTLMPAGTCPGVKFTKEAKAKTKELFSGEKLV